MFQGTCLFAQKKTTLNIAKIKGSYHKTLELPVRTRIITHDEDVIMLRLDSITNTYFYGNNAQDSIAISDIATVNLRGTKEVIKYVAISFCAANVFQVIPYTIADFRSNDKFIYLDLAIMATFASLGTLVYFHPRTRFHSTRHTFQIN